MRRNWREEARQAIERLRDCPYGERELRLRSFASQLQYKNSDPSSLRRAVSAAEFLDRLRREQPFSHARLDGVSLSVAELMARVYEADPTLFPEIAKNWQEGRVTVASMRKLLEGILPSGYAGKVGKARQQSFKDAAAVAIKNMVGDMDLGEIVSMTTRAAQKRPFVVKVDCLFEMSTARTVAVMTVGPYRNATMYRDRAEEWSLRAFGIAWFYDVVVLVLPGPEEAKVYRQRVHQLQAEITQRKLSTPAPRVEVTNIFVEPFGPEYSAVGDLAP